MNAIRDQVSMEVPQGYTLFFKSPLVTSIKDVQIFCLPEIHTGLGHHTKRLNASLIDATIVNNSDKKILVLVESVKSLEIVNQKGHEQVYLCKKELEVRGWDIGLASEILPLSDEQRILLRDIEKAKEEWHIVAHPLSNGGPMSPMEQDHITSLAKKAKEAVDVLTQEFQKSFESEEKMEEEMKEGVKSTFQIRNNEMAETIKKITSLYDIIFIIAGERHFLPEPNQLENDFFNDPEYDLKPLHDFLVSQKAVILDQIKKVDTCAMM